MNKAADKKIMIGADFAGIHLKNAVVEFLTSNG